MKFKLTIPVYSLQIFSEGTGGAGAADGGTAQGQGVTAAAAVPQKADKNPLSSVVYGKQEEEAPVAGVQTTTEEPSDLNAEFDKLIKGQFKEQYNARMQEIIRNRLKSSRETVDKYNTLSPALELLGKKYGVDPTDTAALSKAIENDDSLYSDEALRRGLGVPEMKMFAQIERENTMLKQQAAQANADRMYQSWMEQAEKVRQIYPTFDARAEMENPKFVELLRSNIDMRTAFEVLHKDEIFPAAMQYAAKTVEAKLARSMASGGRPTENGANPSSAAVVKSDVSKLTKADRQEIARRVARGEKIRF